MTDHQEKSGIICAGNWIVDIVHELDHWPPKSGLANISREARGVGGGAANVVTALARFKTGLPLFPVGAVGNDEHAELIFKTCRELDLPLEFLLRRQGVPTAHTHVMSVPGDSRTFFYQGGANDTLAASDFTTELLADSRAKLFYLGYLMLLEKLDTPDGSGGTGGSALLSRAKQSGLITCVDLVSAGREDFAELVRPSLPYIDYLIVNEVEACRASGLPVADTDTVPDDETVEHAARILLNEGVSEAVIIHCPKKALWMPKAGSPVWLRPDRLPPDKVVSPVGAGDAFCAGIVYAVHESMEPANALALGHAAARASLLGMTATDAIPPLTELMGL